MKSRSLARSSPLAGAGRDRGRNTAIYLAGACTEKICATASLISRQRSGGVRSVRPVVSHVYLYARHRLHLPHSDCLKYLFTSSARDGAIRSHASNYHACARARARRNVRFYPCVLRRAPFNTGDGTFRFSRYTRCAYISPRTQGPMMFTAEKAVSPAVTSSWLIALSSSRSAHPPAERRDRKNSNFACAADKTASSYI